MRPVEARRCRFGLPRLGRAGLLLMLLLAAWPRGAHANDFDDFQQARDAYDGQDYARAAELFEALVGGDVPRLTNRPLLLESRKYLAASYLFVGQRELARAEFGRLLELEPGYVLDPLAFPKEVQDLFAGVKAKNDQVLEEVAARRQQARARRREADQRRQAVNRRRLQRLIKLASTERVEEHRSRWVAAVPFGVGQFQNGHDGLGLVLAVSETALLALNVTTYILHQDLPEQPEDIDTVRRVEGIYRFSNQVSLALFAVLAVTGILDAQLRFEPVQSHERRRPLPDDLEGGIELTGNGVRVRF